MATKSNAFSTLAQGMFAGAVGTAAMSLTQQLEMAVSGRDPSPVPGQVAAHLLPGCNPESPSDVQRLNIPMHWAHGITMGALRGVLERAGLNGSTATAVHFAMLWGGDAALYRTLGVADAPWRWGTDALVTDLFHKGVYAAVTGAVYDAMSGDATSS